MSLLASINFYRADDDSNARAETAHCLACPFILLLHYGVEADTRGISPLPRLGVPETIPTQWLRAWDQDYSGQAKGTI